MPGFFKEKSTKTVENYWRGALPLFFDFPQGEKVNFALSSKRLFAFRQGQSSILQNLQKYCRLAVQWQTKSLHKTNAIAKPGIRLCPQGSRCDPRKRFWIRVLCAAKYHFRFGEKYHPVLLLTESRKEPAPLPRGRKDYSFSKGKRKGRSFCDVTKGTKSTEKGRRLPLPFSNPTPLTNKGDRTFSVCAKFPGAARQKGNRELWSV